MTTKKTTKSGKATKPASAAKAATKPKADKAAATAKAAAPKRSRTKAAITKPVAAAKAARVAPASPASPTGSTEITKKALVERFMEESGMKKGEARKAVDAMLVVLHGAIHEGRDMAVAPLGKIRVVRKKETPNGELAVLRVKLRDPAKMPASTAGNQGIADAAE